MSADLSPPSTDDSAPGERLDFEALAGTDQTSWERADPEKALIEPLGRYGYRVTLPDGDAHLVAVAVEDGEYVGDCDCKAAEYHDDPCAHLSTVRKAAFAGDEDVHGDPVTIPRVDLDAHERGEQAVADGGHVDRAQRADTEGRR